MTTAWFSRSGGVTLETGSSAWFTRDGGVVLESEVNAVTLTAANCAQANTSPGGAISTSSSVTLTAANCTQANTSPGGAITIRTGTLTGHELRNNTGALQTGISLSAYVHDPAAGTLIKKITGLTSDAVTAVPACTDWTIVPGTSYRVIWQNTGNGAEGLETLTAA